MSDIFIKAGDGWKKASKLWVKDGTWRTVTNVWIRNLTQWLKVWPLSGIFASRAPWIANLSSDTYANRMPTTAAPVIRIGMSYFGNNAQWDLNGWSASSYQYAWKLYDEFGNDLTASLGASYTLRSGSTWSVQTPTAGGNGQDQLPTNIWTSTNSTNSDRQFLKFQVTAVNSSNTVYNGLSLSTGIKIIREKPVFQSNSLSTNSPQIGTAITYTSTWQSGEAYKAESSRTIIEWYKNSTNSTTGGTKIASGTSYTPTTNNTTFNTGSDVDFYIYVVETRYNSGTDYEDGSTPIGVESTRIITTNKVAAQPDAFTYTIVNNSTVTTPSTPTQTRESATSNKVLVNFASSTPADTFDYTLHWSGSGAASPGNTTIAILNQYANNNDYSVDISTTANNSPINTYVVSNGVYRDIYINLSSTTGAQSWAVNFTWSNSTAFGMTYYTNGTAVNPSGTGATVTATSNSITSGQFLIARVAGTSNPTITINSVTAYSSTGQTGASRSGTAGTPSSLSSIPRPTATSGTSTTNWTYINPEYTVTWNATDQGGTGGGSTTQNAGVSHIAPSASKNSFTITYASSGQTSGTVPTASQATYVFRGYWDNTNAASAAYGPIAIGGSFTPPSNITMFGLWQTTSNAISLSNQGTLLRDGHSFGGWSIGGVTYSAGASYTPTQNVTATAIWTPNTYTISYNKNTSSAVSGIPSDQTKTHGVNLTLSSATPSRTNYTFNGWNTAADGSGTSYSAGAIYTANTGAVLYAQWTIIQYTVTWDANSGTVSPTSSTVNAGSSVTAPTPSRTGYTFANWRNPLSGGTDPVTVSAGGSYTPTANITFYAIWTINTYTVSYNANGATSGTAPANQTKTHDVALTLAAQGTLSRTGYTFDGWYTTASGTGGTAYSAGGSYTGNAGLTLYAKWNIIQYTVTWNANGGTVSPTSSTVNAGSSVTAPTPSRTNYTFARWRNPLSGGTDPVTVSAGGSYTPTANITFYAIWNRNAAPSVPTGVTITRNQTTWNGTSWTWNCTWTAPVSSDTNGPATYYEAYRQVGTGTVGNNTLGTVNHTSTVQTNITTTSTTFSTATQGNSRADAYVRACNSFGCSDYASGTVG